MSESGMYTALYIMLAFIAGVRIGRYDRYLSPPPPTYVARNGCTYYTIRGEMLWRKRAEFLERTLGRVLDAIIGSAGPVPDWAEVLPKWAKDTIRLIQDSLLEYHRINTNDYKPEYKYGDQKYVGTHLDLEKPW